jgi:mannose-6-phosphate isomerase-like protein (cupin superfamily)
MQIIKRTDAPRFALQGVEFEGIAAPSRGSGDVCTWRITVEPGLRSPEPHTLDSAEVFMVIAGSIQLSPESDTVGPGDAAIVPAGMPIQLCNPGDIPAEVYVAIRAGFSAKAADGSPIGPLPWAE